MAMAQVFSHDCYQELKNASLRVTSARLGVLAALEHSKNPLDVSSVIDYLGEQKIKADKVTVFRIINALLEKGLIVPIEFGEGKLRYEHTKRADHHHFVCENCGEIADISDCNVEKLQKDIEKMKKIKIRRHSLEFFGLCGNCLKK